MLVLPFHIYWENVWNRSRKTYQKLLFRKPNMFLIHRIISSIWPWRTLDISFQWLTIRLNITLSHHIPGSNKGSSIVYAVKNFHQYLFGWNFYLYIDQKTNKVCFLKLKQSYLWFQHKFSNRQVCYILIITP